jgi:NTE family protein
MGNLRIGLALGSGSARGWAHIGVIRALAEVGIEPDIICGSSIGALVGGAHAAGQLDTLEAWVNELSMWDVVRLMDIRFAGGLIEGNTLMASINEQIKGIAIEALSAPFAAVATDLASGREVWLQQGSLGDAIRASIALPGLFSPFQREGRWLVDGGLTNPVPISLCRAMGADIIIAVNLNSDLIGRHLTPRRKIPPEKDLLGQIMDRLNINLPDSALASFLNNNKANDTPGMFEVIASTINIMQDRITKSRMAGDPPDVMLSPRLAQLGLLEFDRAKDAIAEGRECVRRMLPAIQHACGTD